MSKGWDEQYATAWRDAESALRRAASVLGGQSGAEVEMAANYLAAIGPDTIKHPCHVCAKPTTLACGRCGRYLCATHGAINTKTLTHDGGELACHGAART